jgi:hypothetical protein
MYELNYDSNRRHTIGMDNLTLCVIDEAVSQVAHPPIGSRRCAKVPEQLDHI